MSRLEGAPKRGGGGRIVPLLLLGLLVVFLGGVYVVLDVLDQMRAERPDTALIAEQASQRTLTAFREGKAEGGDEAELALSRLQDQLQQMEERERALRLRLDAETGGRGELEAEIRGLEVERDGLAAQIRAAQSEVLARRAVEEELRAVNGQLAVIEPRMLDLEASLRAEKSENARLRERLGAIGLGRPDPGAADEPGSPADPDAAEPEAAVQPPPLVPGRRIERDPVLLDKIRDRLNQMLDQTSQGRTDLWQVTRIDGVHPEGLQGVIALRYDRDLGTTAPAGAGARPGPLGRSRGPRRHVRVPQRTERDVGGQLAVRRGHVPPDGRRRRHDARLESERHDLPALPLRRPAAGSSRRPRASPATGSRWRSRVRCARRSPRSRRPAADRPTRR